MQTLTLDQTLGAPEPVGPTPFPAPHMVELDALVAEVAATHPTLVYTVDDEDARGAFDAAIFAGLVAP